jgi:hypothetical protein
MAGYYDVVLGLIPLGLGTIAAAMLLLGFEPTVAVPVGSAFALVLIGHAMFVRAPTDAVPEVGTGGGPAPAAD